MEVTFALAIIFSERHLSFFKIINVNEAEPPTR